MTQVRPELIANEPLYCLNPFQNKHFHSFHEPLRWSCIAKFEAPSGLFRWTSLRKALIASDYGFNSEVGSISAAPSGSTLSESSFSRTAAGNRAKLRRKSKVFFVSSKFRNTGKLVSFDFEGSNMSLKNAERRQLSFS